jgi:acyl-CoA thioesterase I
MKSHFFLSLAFLVLNLFTQFSIAQNLTEKNKTLLIIGDSITEGYGIAKESAYPALLEKLIKQNKKNWNVINAGVSGATSASGVGRFNWHLKTKPDLIILALGANDGLRGFKVSETRKNLTDVIQLAKSNKVEIILAGMQMPPNYGTQYTKEFKEIFYKVAKENKTKFIPFLLDNVAGQSKLNLADGIHPNEKGHQVIAEMVFKNIKDLL